MLPPLGEKIVGQAVIASGGTNPLPVALADEVEQTVAGVPGVEQHVNLAGFGQVRRDFV
jgi:hypothetical protein